ncbi:hypothetical protein Tco_0255653 [Tanacetum coccineum]
MSANDDFSLHDDEELSLHDDASLAGSVPASNKGDAPAKPPQIITTNTLSNIKLPVLQKDDYDTWAMEMEHYLEYIDNEVWKVIQNGNSKKRVTKGKDGVYRILPPTTQAEQVADEKERKARTLLLMAVPKDHLRRFHGMDDAKRDLGSHQDTAGSRRGRIQPVRTEKEALMTIDEGQINWVEQTADEELNHALMAFTVNNEVSMCSKLCLDSYNALQAKYDELQSEFGDQEAALIAHKLAVKKLESQLRASHKQQSSLTEKLNFQANQIFEKDEKLKKYRRIGMKAVKDKDALQKIVDSWFASSKNLWKLIDCGMSSTVKIGLGYGIQSNAEVLGYEEEISRGIFALRETDAGYYDIPLYSRFKQVEYKGVPHPLSGDYTPREQEDIDDSLYEYGKYGPQPQSPSPTVSDASSTVYSTCPSNDSDGELGAVSDHSVNDDPIHDHIPIPSIEQVTIATQKTQPQVPKPKQTVVPSCAQHVKTPRQPIRTPVTPSPIPSNNRQNWNQRMERELGAGYSFERKTCFVCGSLSHLIKDCDYYEKKMAREAALKSQRVVHADVRQATPAWTNTNRVNKANQFTPRPVQLSNIRPNLSTASKTIKTGRVNVNTGHGNVSTVSSAGTQIKSGSSRFNTGKQNVNSGSVHVNTARVNRPVSNQTSNKTSPKLSQVNLKSPKKCFSKQSSPVNRPFSRNTAYKSNKYAVKGKMGTAVKTSAGCVWRKAIPLSNTNSGPTPDSNVHDHPLKHMEHRGIFDSGCSGHMTGNRAHLEDYQELSKVGSVTFGGSKGSISGKGTIRLGNLVFDDVAFVKELGHFNLFSISQICDKKLNVLFTEKECFVVSSDFKMPDENQVLLKVPRQHNMYTFDMKNVDSSKGYTCFITKASSNEAKLVGKEDQAAEQTPYEAFMVWPQTKSLATYRPLGAMLPFSKYSLATRKSQPQPSAAPTPSQPVPTPTPSHVQIPTPPITSTPPSTQPPPLTQTVQSTPTLTQPVQSTTPPPQPSKGPSFEPSYHMSPPPSHEPEIQTSRTSEESEQLRNLLDLVPRLESRVESLEKELSDTKQILGTAVLQLIKKVKKLENTLRQKRKREETEDEEDAEGQDQDIPSQTDQGNEFATPEKSKDSGEAQAEQISPSTLEAAQILTNVASEGFKGSQAPPGSKIYRRKPKSTATPTKVLDFEEPAERPVNTGSTPSAELNTGETERVQRREGKDPMTEEDLQAEVQASKKSKELQELADLEAAQRLQATMDAEAQRQIHLDALLARRLVEQEEEAAKEALATEFDYIQARLNADQILAEKIQQEEREQYSIEDRAKFLHDTIAAQRKFLAEQRYAAIRNKPPTISQLRNQMITYLKHVANKKHAELKSKSFEEIQINKQAADKEKEQKVASVHEEVKEEAGAKKRKLGTRRKLKAKRRKYTSGPNQEKVMTEDLKAVYELVMKKYQDEIPEGFDTMLWGDLMIMFNQGNTADFWDEQLNWKIISWKLHSSSGVHTIMTLGKLKNDTHYGFCGVLIKFVKQQLEEFERFDDDDLAKSDHEEAERVLSVANITQQWSFGSPCQTDKELTSPRAKRVLLDFGYSNSNDIIQNEGLLDLRKVEGCMFCGGERYGEELVVVGEVSVFLLGRGDGGRL